MPGRCYFQSILLIFAVLLNTPVASWAQESTVQKIQPIVISIPVRAQGSITISLDIEKQFGIKTDSKFYQGEISRHGVKYPVAGATINGTTKITFLGKRTGSRHSRQRLYTASIKNGRIKISSVPSTVLGEKSCGSEQRVAKPATTGITIAEEAMTRVVTISTYADPEFVYQVGRTANDEIASFINVAEALYERQLGIRFKILEQVTLTSSTPELAATEVLDKFRQSRRETTSNTQILFTGKDLTDSTVGVAYVSSICYAPEYAQSVVQFYGELTSNIFAHEIGHSLGSPHDTESPGSIMYPMISFGAPYFSPKSVSDISTFVSAYGMCITTQTLPPSLSGATLKLSKAAGSKVVVTLMSRNNIGLANEPVKIVVGHKSYHVRTNRAGQAYVVLKKYKRKYIFLYAEAANNVAVSDYRRLRIT